jgi:ribose transport system substrate-binding protein
LAGTALVGSVQAQDKYTFALVPKNTNNPFFDQARDGCKKAERNRTVRSSASMSAPASTAAATSRCRSWPDLVAKGVDGIAVSPANAAAMGAALRDAQAAGIPVLTWDSDLPARGQGLRIAYVGTYNYDIGTNIGKAVMEIKPEGGTICIQSGGAAAANHNERMQGIRDTLRGTKSEAGPGPALAGEKRLDGSGRLPALHQ